MPLKDKNKRAAYAKLYSQKHRLLNHKVYLKRAALYRQNNKDKIITYHRQNRHILKLAAYDAYGSRICIWCKEDDISVMNIDHIDNNGASHLDKKGYKIQGSRLYTWLKKNNYPPGFQILCCNCNFAKSCNNGLLPLHRKDLHAKR